MQYRIPHSVQALETATYAALEANGLSGDAYIRPVAWRGADFIGIGSPNPQINVSIAAFAWNKQHTPEKRESGVRLAISEWRRAPAGVFPPQAKSSANYAIGTMSWNSAVARGFDDAMLLDTEGNIAESTGANIFFVIDGALHTPAPDCFLAGITRSTVLEIAESLGIRTVIGKVTVTEALGADEVFLCGTAYEVLPVAAIEDSCYASGPITKRIRAAYQGLVNA
jgi:branched-chain amino acid aminotransferase